MDHTLSKSREAEGKLTHSKKALDDFEKKLKEALFHLAEVEKGAKTSKLPWQGLKNKPRSCESP